MSKRAINKSVKMIYNIAYKRIEETEDILSDQLLKAVLVKYPKEFRIPIMFKILEQANPRYLYLMVDCISNRYSKNDYFKIREIVLKHNGKQSSKNTLENAANNISEDDEGDISESNLRVLIQGSPYRKLNKVLTRFDYKKTLKRIEDIDKELYKKYCAFAYSEGFDVDFIIKEVKNNSKELADRINASNPPKKYELDECPVCTSKKFKYVWLDCGHNICYHCFKELKKDSKNSIKCPYCCSVTHF